VIIKFEVQLFWKLSSIADLNSCARPAVC